MKKSEIKIGAVYNMRNGREYKVIDRGYYPNYDNQENFDCILYEIVRDGKRENCFAGRRMQMTATAFASWAKEEVQGV